MIIIKTILSAGGACPYQLEAVTQNDEYFYLRYRGGRLRAGHASSGIEFWKKSNPYDVIDVELGDPLGGFAYHQDIYPLIKDKVKLPEDFKISSEDTVDPNDLK